ncbi:hypothetical protein SKAU_G00148280 [Synaphobranchus kaupii]|uniref:Uncharacterized protein n=1 Tax=Synaphobranchus kaupii TaxID=118154 RepID=A0A9Q1FUM2_SYNKA|nr:hypothetical protein SKAU_G00148280 [Synaphobranchus kaupii]
MHAEKQSEAPSLTGGGVTEVLMADSSEGLYSAPLFPAATFHSTLSLFLLRINLRAGHKTTCLSGSSPVVSAKPHPSTAAASRLKHLQQSSPEKSKTGKLRDDFLKNQGQQQ